MRVVSSHQTLPSSPNCLLHSSFTIKSVLIHSNLLFVCTDSMTKEVVGCDGDKESKGLKEKDCMI